MTTDYDYDTPRRNTEVHSDLGEDPDVQQIKARHTAQEAEPDRRVDAAADLGLAGDSDAPSADVLTVEVVPAQLDEFTCSRCHLVQHRSQLVEQHNEHLTCYDCS